MIHVEIKDSYIVSRKIKLIIKHNHGQFKKKRKNTDILCLSSVMKDYKTKLNLYDFILLIYSFVLDIIKSIYNLNDLCDV